MHGEHAVTIRRPAAVVFEHIADGARNPQWRPTVVEVALHSGDGRGGTVWRQVVRGPAGKSADADYQVTRYEPPTLYAVEVIAGPMRGAATYTLTPDFDGDATTVSLDVVLKPRGAMRVLSGFVLRQLVDELNSLDMLRDLLDSRRERPGGA